MNVGAFWDKLKRYGFDYKDWDLSEFDPKTWGAGGSRATSGMSYDPNSRNWLTNVWGKKANFGKLGENYFKDQFSWLPGFDPGSAHGRYPFEGITPSITSEDIVTLQGRNYFGREQRANRDILDKYKRLNQMGYKHLDPRNYTQFDAKMGTLGGLGGGEPYPIGRHGQTGGLYQDSLGNWHRRASGMMSGSVANTTGTGNPVDPVGTGPSHYTGSYMDKKGVFSYLADEENAKGDFSKMPQPPRANAPSWEWKKYYNKIEGWKNNTFYKQMLNDLAYSNKGYNDVENSLRSVANLGIYGPEGMNTILQAGPLKVQRQLNDMLPNLITAANQSEALGRENAARALTNFMPSNLAGQPGQLSKVMADNILSPSLQNQATRNMKLTKGVEEQKNMMDLAVSDLIKENMHSKYQAIQDLAKVASMRSGNVGVLGTILNTSSDHEKMQFNERMQHIAQNHELTRDEMQHYYRMTEQYYEYLYKKDLKGSGGLFGDILGGIVSIFEAWNQLNKDEEDEPEYNVPE